MLLAWSFIITALIALGYVARDAWLGDLSNPWRIGRTLLVVSLGFVLLALR